ncbi:MAG: transcriptional repressor LexA [Rhodocyclaceae bacterium]|nr:transcriptional repressor LexA [Rhodocyclaceae bacterium]
MDAKLTPRQQEILDFIRSTLEILGAPPTRLEICEAFGFASPNAAEDHLRALAKKGVIILEPGSARGIRLVEQLGLPLVGSVAAGSPILAVENQLGKVQLDPGLFSPRADYLLRVRGNSMVDAGILDGDLLAVHRTGEARSGQIVVARLDDEVTVKRLKRHRGGRVELLPENPDYAPIPVEGHDLAIEGIAVGLIRNGKAL